MISDEIKNINGTKKQLREFGLLVGGVFLILGGLFLWQGKELYPYLFGISSFLLIVGLISPIILKPVYKIWMGFAHILGFTMTRVILSILFYFVITPIGVIARFINRDFFNLELNRKQTSYWIYRENKPFCKESYENQF